MSDEEWADNPTAVMVMRETLAYIQRQPQLLNEPVEEVIALLMARLLAEGKLEITTADDE